jgi:hypothetical protein
MSSVADARPECLGAERRVDRSDGDVAWASGQVIHSPMPAQKAE